MATHHNNMPFLLERKDVELVKPAKPTPFEVLSFSSIDNDRNLELLCQSIYVYQAKPILSNGNAHHRDGIASKFNCKGADSDPACVIKDAISNVLVQYYPLAGKLKRNSDGRLNITCSGDGVPFLEATANCQLSSLHYLDGIDVDIAKQFVFDFPSKIESGYYPLVFQVTKFSCGGFTIGMGLSHSVCDGFGASQFFRAMAEFASGKTEPTLKPVWERERLELRDENGVTKESFSTLEVLGAYIWRSRFRAFKLNPDGKTIFFLTMGIRQLLNPPLPSGYYGNAISSSTVDLMGRNLNEGPLSEAVKLIKESKKLASNSDYIWNRINIMETLIEKNIKIEAGSGAVMVLTDWRQLGLLEEVDFGWKAAVNIIPVPWNMFGYVDLCIFLPPSNLDSSMKGGVRVLISLPRAAMPKFKEEMDALLQLGDEEANP
ncbi:hypothetical protein GH714_010726 [Hevea brasiliensis]|uniref:Uncharacterized protein n=1 Tax=Hevea brasiliensis TaxID=3981 RepID=A0A6A6L7A3_HEVBR|nr:hypothetical protein GH714_010726 [Hevea brasiliensis]